MKGSFKNQARANGRALDQIRDINFFVDALGYASASVLFSQGNTKVLASVTIQQGLPHFLKGQPVGWLSAEYAMLPCATHQRNNREASQIQRNARSVEISRLIGRCLRTCVNLSALREKTITVDCDVLQADGGTRVACITAASLALEIAAKRWFNEKITETNIFKQGIAGISVGLVKNNLVADLDFQEDSSADADFNFIITKDQRLVEIQGTSEKTPLAWEQFDAAKALAEEGAKKIFATIYEQLSKINVQANTSIEEIFSSINNQQSNQQHLGHKADSKKLEQKPGPFSLGNRISKS